MVQIFPKITRSVVIDSQVQSVLRGKAFNTTVYLHQQTLNKGQKKTDNCNSLEASYPTPYEMLFVFGKPSHNNYTYNISYKAPFQDIRLFS
jgi:hypothetical protein